MNIKNKIGIAAGAVGAVVAVAAVLSDKKTASDIVLPEGFTVTAHTGCEGSKDNSLDAITLGYGYGADIVEFDLNFNEEGTAVLSHDAPKGMEATLDSAFALISKYEKLRVNIDVKNTLDIAQAITLAEKYSLTDRIFFTGVTEEFVDAVKAAAPGYIYYLNTGIDKKRVDDILYINELIDKVKSVGAVGLNIHYKTCSQLMIDEFHKNGLKVSLWTVNKKSDMLKVLALGSDNITTRNPSKLKVYLDMIKK